MQAPDSPLQQIITAVVPLVVTLLTVALSALANQIRQRIQKAEARDMGLRLTEVASDVVHELEQTWASKLREAAADGVIDAADVADLKATALANFKAYLGDKGQSDALKVLGFKSEEELEKVLRAKLEAEVAKLKTTLGQKIKSTVEGLR